MRNLIAELEDCSFRYDAVKNIFLRKGEVRNYSNKLVLESVNITLKKNAIYGVLGKNGSGKSTLIKLIFGVLKPSAGIVKRNFTKGKLLDTPLFFHNELSSLDNFNAIYSLETFEKLNTDNFDKKLVVFKELCQLNNEDLYKPISNLSSGMKAKVGFALTMTFLENVDFLGLDEFFSFGDAEYKKFSTNFLKSKIKESGSAIIISHSLDVLSNSCDEIIYIDKGRVENIDKPENIISQYTKHLK